MNTLLREMPDFTTSWWRYTLAMMRATNREVSEFNDNLFIAAAAACLFGFEPMTGRECHN